MNQLAKALILGLILCTPTAVVIPTAQAQNTPPSNTKPVETEPETTTPIKKIYPENTRRTKTKANRPLTRAEIRKISRKKERKQIRRQERRQARKDAIQNFGKQLIPGQNQ